MRQRRTQVREAELAQLARQPSTPPLRCCPWWVRTQVREAELAQLARQPSTLRWKVVTYFSGITRPD